MPLTISLSPSGFFLTDEAGHTIEIPRTLPGLEIIDRILRARQATSTPRIGTDSRPTQAMVKEFLKINRVPAGKTSAQLAQRVNRYAHLDLNLSL